MNNPTTVDAAEDPRCIDRWQQFEFAGRYIEVDRVAPAASLSFKIHTPLSYQTISHH